MMAGCDILLMPSQCRIERCQLVCLHLRIGLLHDIHDMFEHRAIYLLCVIICHIMRCMSAQSDSVVRSFPGTSHAASHRCMHSSIFAQQEAAL